MTTPLRRRTRSLRARLLAWITGGVDALKRAWFLLVNAQRRLLSALASIRPGRGSGSRIREVVAAFNTSLAAFNRQAMAFAERWAATDLPLIYREGARHTLESVDRRRDLFTWTGRHRGAVTALSAQFYADITSRITEALRRARAFLRDVQDVVRDPNAGRFDPDALRQAHRLDTVVYSNDSHHPVEAWAHAAVTWQAVTTANTAAARTALDELGTEWLEVRDGPQCVMPGGAFLPHGHLKQMVRAWFSGPAYRITRRTSVGTDLITVGPNHPVLTVRGWVRAHLLREGDQLVYDRLSEDAATRTELHLEQVPMVEDVYASLVKALPVSVRPATRHDLHGDGIFSQGEVHVVSVERGLLGETDPSGAQHVSEHALMGSDDPVCSSLSDGSLPQTLPAGGFSSNSIVGGPGTFFPGVGPGVRVPQPQSLGASTGDLHALDDTVDLGDFEPEKISDLARLASVFDVEAAYLLTRKLSSADLGAVVTAEPSFAVVEGREADPADLTCGSDGSLSTIQLPHRFSLSRVEEISAEHYEGWVYDATTSGGTFTIDGVIVANCGWNSHDDPDRANRTLRTVQDALAHPAAHPNCRRELLPRLDLVGRTEIRSGAAL